jgi:putative membrane protein
MSGQPAPIDGHAGRPIERSDERTVKADTSTRLAVTRTMVALDRTLMAWIRTSVSLISFGFTIYKFFQYLRNDTSVTHTERLLSPRGVALVLIGLGVGALSLATLDYRSQRQALAAEYHEYGPVHFSIAAAVSTVISGLGIVGFVLVFLRQ